MSRARMLAVSFVVVSLMGAGGAVGLAQSPSPQPAASPAAPPSCPPAVTGSTPPAASPAASVAPGASMAAPAASTAPADPCAGTQVTATLTEMAIAMDASTVPAGTTTFTITNAGTTEHEFIVIATDLAADKLPIGDGGVVDLTSLQVVGQALAVQPGTTTTLTLDLPAGPYVIICNIAGHYLAGMHTTLTVQ